MNIRKYQLIVLLALAVLSALVSSCNTQKECCKQKTTCVVPTKSEHSYHWYVQQDIVRQLKNASESEVNLFINNYFPNENGLDKLDSLTQK
jgi:hypothetical protein